MKFGLFGGARAKQSGPSGDSQGYGDFIAYVQAAERLGFQSVFLVEHHFTGFAQVSASLTLLSYLAACTRTIRLGTAVVVLPWHNRSALGRPARFRRRQRLSRLRVLGLLRAHRRGD
jgi:alkanesulfonate monooxygenase SsuD/methylene tetrahydromethanopterin reductase-like flavin-dependent oxidoreductase (luciferase family)